MEGVYTDPSEVELERVVGGERDMESPAEVLGEGAAVIVQEQMVVAEWRHGHTHLGQVVQVLDARNLHHTHAHTHRRMSIIIKTSVVE